MKRITKLFQSRATSINDDAKTVRFKISDRKPDRMGEVVDQRSWDFKSYLKNPIILWGHNPDEPENVLGTAQSLEIAGDGSYTEAELHFDTDINPKAALVYSQIKAGTLNTVSVGFIPHTTDSEDDVPVLKDNELLEISVVPIPANPRAIALAYKEGSLSRKDANWLLDSMRKESQLLEEQMASQPEVNERKKMNEEQAQALLDAVNKLTAKVEAQGEELTAIRTQQEEQEKQRQEAEAKAAEEAAKAEEEANKQEEEAAASAKPGEDDQGGAGEGEAFDEDVELTPELQAEIDAALEDVELPSAA